MTAGMTTCTRIDRVHEVMVKMANTRMRHLLVVESGRLCGIVSIGDVVKKSVARGRARGECLAGRLSSDPLKVLANEGSAS